MYAAINYMILSRCLFYIPYLSPMHPGRVLTTFLAIDGIVEILIGNGASRMANSSTSEHNRRLGGDLVKSALIIQAIMFFLFVMVAVSFHRKTRKAGVLTKGIRTVLIVLYISSALITIRCIYRIVEFFEGWTGTLYTTESYFWVFEAAIMFLNTLMLNIWHPGQSLPPDNHLYLSRDGVTELRGPGWKDNRPFIVTFFDPFDIYGLFTGRDKKTAFWDMTPEEWEALQAEERRLAEEKANRPREWWMWVLDPLHLYGTKGHLTLLVEKIKTKARGKNKPEVKVNEAVVRGEKKDKTVGGSEVVREV